MIKAKFKIEVELKESVLWGTQNYSEEITVPATVDVTAYVGVCVGLLVACIENASSMDSLEVQAVLKDWRQKCEKGVGKLLIMPDQGLPS